MIVNKFCYSTIAEVPNESWNEHVAHVEYEVSNLQNQTKDINSTLSKIYEKEMLAMKQLGRISKELKKLQTIVPVFIILRALRPIFRNLIKRYL